MPGDPNTAEPEWHRLLRPFIPERFEYAALVLRNPDQIRVVAIDPTDGKALEIFIGRGLTLNDQEGATDEVGTWTQLTGSGWGVITPTGFGVEMTCEIGSPARGDSGRNYCEVQGVLPFAMDQIRAAVETMATSIDAAILDADLGVPVDDVALDPGALTELVSSAVPDPNLTLLREMSIGFGDRVFEFGTEAARPTTAVRVLRGLYPSPPATGRAMFALYDDAAAIWMSRADGVAVRLTSTDPSPESLERLEQLGRRLLDDSTLSPNPGLELPATSWPPALATTTIAP